MVLRLGRRELAVLCGSDYMSLTIFCCRSTTLIQLDACSKLIKRLAEFAFSFSVLSEWRRTEESTRLCTIWLVLNRRLVVTFQLCDVKRGHPSRALAPKAGSGGSRRGEQDDRQEERI